MGNGYIILRRDCRDSAWYAEATPLVRNLWFELMLKANWKAGTTKSGVALVAGELVTTWGAMVKHLTWTERGRQKPLAVAAVRRAMAFLEEAGEVRCTGLKSHGAYPSSRIAKPAADRAAGPHQWLGIRVTILRWAFYTTCPARADAEAADQAAEGSAGGAAETLKYYTMNKRGSHEGQAPVLRLTDRQAHDNRIHGRIAPMMAQPAPSEVDMQAVAAVDVQAALAKRRAGEVLTVPEAIAIHRHDEQNRVEKAKRELRGRHQPHGDGR